MIRRYPSQRSLCAVLVTSTAALTAACSQSSDPPASVSGVNRALFTEQEYGVRTSPRVVRHSGPVPKGGGTYKLGSPYKVAGRWYTPREDRNYDRIGIASWYGADFHGRRTANGETFDMTALTAAHPTFPLPSFAYVTNLDSGRTILVRVNDRGPYVGDRIIDLSHASARALGYVGQGKARVRVRYAGRAPLNGDDRHERRFLAEQQSVGQRPRMAAMQDAPAPRLVSEPAPAMRAASWSPTAYRASLAGKSSPSYLGGPISAEGASPAQARSQDLKAKGVSYIDAGLFADRDRADALGRVLNAIAPIEVAPFDAEDGSQNYRVRLGPISRADVDRVLSRVAEHGVSNASVVE